MSVIGTFAATRDGYAGRIRTLTINSRVRIIANDRKTKEGAPDYRVVAGEAEIGVAWRIVKPGSEASHLRVRLDDPALSKPIWAALIEPAADGVNLLIWRRHKPEAR
ncbi:MAG TPA: DUF736 domain-containing protein [Hyphomicrobiales bacterium]|nr:DUF736 domain-containing protein [Hyphomicrobiales bacterium]